MFHGLNNDFLYSAFKIKVTFYDDLGNPDIRKGTAFFVQNKKGEMCLITNRHLVDAKYKNNSTNRQDLKIHEITVTGKQGNINTAEAPQEEKTYSLAGIVQGFQQPIFSSNYENDVASFNKVIFFNENEEELTIDFYAPYELIANDIDINTKLSVCDFVAFPSFQEWHDKKENRPIFRTGTISSDPRTNYSNDKGGVSGNCIAYEAFSYGGSSGSPVFAMQKGTSTMQGSREALLIGINAGHLNVQNTETIYTHSGISYFYKSSIILEIIDA